MGTRENCLSEAVLTSTHNLCFAQKYKKYQSFLSENFQFLEVKFSIYLNRHFRNDEVPFVNPARSGIQFTAVHSCMALHYTEPLLSYLHYLDMT